MIQFFLAFLVVIFWLHSITKVSFLGTGSCAEGNKTSFWFLPYFPTNCILIPLIHSSYRKHIFSSSFYMANTAFKKIILLCTKCYYSSRLKPSFPRNFVQKDGVFESYENKYHCGICPARHVRNYYCFVLETE